MADAEGEEGADEEALTQDGIARLEVVRRTAVARVRGAVVLTMGADATGGTTCDWAVRDDGVTRRETMRWTEEAWVLGAMELTVGAGMM